jgi:hypothetical protein
MSDRKLSKLSKFCKLKLLQLCLAKKYLVVLSLTTSLLVMSWGNLPITAQTTDYCHQPEAARQEKEDLLQKTLQGDPEAQSRYKQLLNQQAQQLSQCRDRTPPQHQAIWLRLYPCDTQPGVLDKIMDRIVNKGYNYVYIETFADGQVLLPASANPTAWPSMVRTPGTENTDLLAQAIQKARERGLKAYAWMFMMNFGYSYGQRSDRQSVLLRNFQGDTSINVVDNASQVFIDPYSIQAKRDFYQLVQQVVRRRPDGVLFDYVRYPRGLGGASVVAKVQDLWIYSEASRQALEQRALNNKGRELIRRYIGKGAIVASDVEEVDKLYPDEGEPLWQGRTPPTPEEKKVLPSAGARRPVLQLELWRLSVAHALQGILDFVALATSPVQQQGVQAGLVFFPDGNQVVGEGYDSRLQPWDRFPTSAEWHPMSYAACGNPECIATLVQRVFEYAPPEAKVIPAIAGVWGQPVNNRPSLEAQMSAIERVAPQVKGISHFAFSWQEPEIENLRKSCRWK